MHYTTHQYLTAKELRQTQLCRLEHEYGNDIPQALLAETPAHAFRMFDIAVYQQIDLNYQRLSKLAIFTLRNAPDIQELFTWDESGKVTCHARWFNLTWFDHLKIWLEEKIFYRNDYFQQVNN